MGIIGTCKTTVCLIGRPACSLAEMHNTFMKSYRIILQCNAAMVSYLTIKADPLQAWSGPKGSRKLRFPDFMITAQDGGKVVSLKHRPPLPAGNTPGTHFC